MRRPMSFWDKVVLGVVAVFLLKACTGMSTNGGEHHNPPPPRTGWHAPCNANFKGGC